MQNQLGCQFFGIDLTFEISCTAVDKYFLISLWSGESPHAFATPHESHL